jgi:hypothetical protein
MIEAFTARSGAPTLRIDGVAVHSPYDPVREALRFVRESLGAESPSTVIVLGEALGHAGAAVSAVFPGARVLLVSYSPEVARLALPAPVPSWDPSMPGTVAEFLRRHLGELDVEGLRVLEWPPCARLFPEVSRQANAAVRQVVQELNGSFVTSVGAGRRWVRNSVANCLFLDRPLSGRPCAGSRPVVICAPGLSLEAAIHAILEVRGRVEVWALPSSVPCLADAGLLPDLVVMTDPGYYAVHHLAFDPLPCPIAMPLSAARGTWGLRWSPGGLRGHLVLSQPVPFELALLEAVGLAAPSVPPHGTVAATAVDLALSSTSGPVIVAGLDMCFSDLLSHARPNAFDRLLLVQAGRLSPFEGLLHARASSQNARREPGTGIRTSPALRTYAGWFDQPGAGSSPRVRRLLPSPVALAGMSDLTIEGLRGLVGNLPAGPRGPQLSPVAGYPVLDERKRIVHGLVRRWRETLQAVHPRRAGAAVDPETARAALGLAYVISPRLLMESLRKSRRGDPEGAGAARVEMLDDCALFLDGLERRIGCDA